MADSQSQPPNPQQWCYRKLINIGAEGIRLKPRPAIDSHGDGYVFHDGNYVSHLFPTNIFPTSPLNESHTAYVHVYSAVPGIRAQGYINSMYLSNRIEFNPPGYPPLNGGLRRRTFRSHKKRHVKSRPRSNKSRSKKSCSRRR